MLTQRALTFLASIAVLSLIGLVVCGVHPGDQANVEATLSGTLTGSAFAIAALVSPQQSRSVEADLRRPGGQ